MIRTPKLKIHENERRISKDSYFLEIASTIGKRSTCLKHKVGCILVRDNQILSTGYNGAARGLDHCIDIGCIRDDIESGTVMEHCRAIHAEQNSIINAAKQGTSIKGAICYCTHKPCITCFKMLINAEIAEIHFMEDYPINLDILGDVKINIIKHDI
jgi:dCMP deaminase